MVKNTNCLASKKSIYNIYIYIYFIGVPSCLPRVFSFKKNSIQIYIDSGNTIVELIGKRFYVLRWIIMNRDQ